VSKLWRNITTNKRRAIQLMPHKILSHHDMMHTNDLLDELEDIGTIRVTTLLNHPKVDLIAYKICEINLGVVGMIIPHMIAYVPTNN
jgi:hypothetical protein